jgi:hypothetical protein
MIRNAVLHLLNEQPLLADLPVAPTPGDGVLICTNLRTMDGKRPFFVDGSASTFVFPLTQMRFVEIPAAAIAAGEHPVAASATVAGAGSSAVPGVGSTSAGGPVAAAAHSASAPGPAAAEPALDDLDLHRELLRRVRDI